MLKHLESVFIIFEYHANSGPIDALTKITSLYREYLGEVVQTTNVCHHHAYPTNMFLAKLLSDRQPNCAVTFNHLDLVTDEMVIPSSLAFNTVEGYNLRTGKLPGVTDKSKSNNAISVTFDSSCTQLSQYVKKAIDIETLSLRACEDGLSIFQYKEGINWKEVHFQKAQTEFTVLSTRRLSAEELFGLETELVQLRIQHNFV